MPEINISDMDWEQFYTNRLNPYTKMIFALKTKAG